jgi:hypothetical protein
MLHPGGWSNGTKSNALWCAPPSVLPLCLARAVATAISIRCRSLIHQRKRAFAGNQRTPLDVMGWRLLNEALKPAWMLGFSFQNLVLFPHLFPRFAFAGPPLPQYNPPLHVCATVRGRGSNYPHQGLQGRTQGTAHPGHAYLPLASGRD